MPVKSYFIIAIFLLIQAISTSQQDESGPHEINQQKNMSGSYNLMSRNIEGETAAEESMHKNTDVYKNMRNNKLNVMYTKQNGRLEALDETSSTSYLRSRRSATAYGRKGRSQQAYYSQVNLLPGKEIGNKAKYGYSTKEREEISLAATKDNNKYKRYSVAEMKAGGSSKREVEMNHPHLYSENNNYQDPHHHFQFHRSVRYANFPPTNIQQDGHSSQRKRQAQSKYDFQTYPNNLQTNEIEWSSPLSYPISTNSTYGTASQNIPYPYQQYPDSRSIYNHNYFNQHPYPKQSVYNYQPDYHTQSNNLIYSPLSSKQPYKYQRIPFVSSSTAASIAPTQNIPITTMQNPVHINSAHLHSALPFPQKNPFENSIGKIEPSHNEFGEWTEELVFGNVKNSENNYVDILKPLSTFGDDNDISEKYVEDSVPDIVYVTSDNEVGDISSPVILENVKIVEVPYNEIVSVEVLEPLYISKSESQIIDNISTNESNDYPSVDNNIEDKTFVIEKITLTSGTDLTSANISDNTQLPNKDSVQISESLLDVESNESFEQPEKISEISNSLSEFSSHELTKPSQKTVLADEIKLEDFEGTSVGDKTLSVGEGINSPSFQEVLKAFETTSSTTTAIPEIPGEIFDQQTSNTHDREVAQKESSSDQISQSSSLQSSDTTDKVHNESISAPTAIKISSYTEEVNRTTIAKTTETPAPLPLGPKSHRVSLPAEAKNIVIKLPNGQDIIIDIVPPAEVSTSDTKLLPQQHIQLPLYSSLLPRAQSSPQRSQHYRTMNHLETVQTKRELILYHLS
ncbi:uncharacterized protein [Periplaneta americana]|uniref:uncharacterized protein isoform X2 n=1 Tax=Periplaneta americana TaxID=6978 RepID=UPI0037E9928E